MRIRNITCLAGAAFGIAYTVYGIYGAYRTSEIVQTEGMKVVEGLVLCAFTVPFAAVVGLGIGLLIEGLISSFQKSPNPPAITEEEEARESGR